MEMLGEVGCNQAGSLKIMWLVSAYYNIDTPWLDTAYCMYPFSIQLSYAHPYKDRYINSYTQQNVYSDRYAHQREAMAARAQRIKTASYPMAREYRARARTAVRRPSA